MDTVSKNWEEGCRDAMLGIKLPAKVYGDNRAQELCESRGGRPGLPSLISLRFVWT